MKLNKYNSLHNKSGFTLAEVLITLVIVGVVAAMTIPTLMNNTKKQEYVAGLKKANSVLSQALYKMTENNAYPVGDYSFLNDKNFIDEFAKVTSITKKCNNIVSCGNLGVSDYKQLNSGSSSFSDGKTVITSDGQLYSAVKLSSDSNVILGDEDKNNAKWRIHVDVNGGKKPNQFGYDVFWFYVVEYKGIVPAGLGTTNDCNKSSQGISCAAKVLRENAINY